MPPGHLLLQGCHDWVVAIFMQFARPAQRDKQFADMMRLCRPGGRLLLLGYTPAQLALGTGGPSEIDQLYTPDLLRQAFAGCQIEELRSTRPCRRKACGIRARRR
jgi:hypothetical protein